MDAVKFLEERKRMFKNGNPVPGLNIDITYDSEKVVKIVEEWSAKHPIKTRQDVFLEQYPGAKIDDTDVLCVCPAAISPSYRKDGGGCLDSNKYRGCAICRKEFWTKGVE